MLVCPSSLETVYRSTPKVNNIVAWVCLAVWNKIGKQSTGNEKKG